MASLPFSERVLAGMRERGLGLRELCRAADLDPSFLSKVLSGKRSPPWDEAVLRRVARALGLDAAELIVSAGRIPSEWKGVWSSPELFDRVNALVTGRGAAPRAASAAPPREPRESKAVERVVIPARETLSEELL